MSRLARAAAAVTAGLVILAAGPRAAADPPAHPPVFADKTFAEATAATKDTDRLLIVKATAEWCGPCKMMDRTTWVDERVVKWVGDNGLAIQVDVDKSPDVARALKVRAMPTMIVFKKGEEFDRVVGYQDAGQLLGWLEAVKRGERTTDKLKKDAQRVKDDPDAMGMQERLRLAQGLSRAGNHERATEEFLWLWDNMTGREPAMAGVRGSFMAGDMQELAAQYEPAREAFMKLRDTAEGRLRGEDKTWDDLDDWIVLNEVVGEQDKTLAWFDRVKDDPGAAQTIERAGFRLERLLMERERWTDVVKISGDPVKKVRREHSSLRMLEDLPADAVPKDQREQVLAMMREGFRETCGKLHGACLAAEMGPEAERVAAEAVRLDDTPEMRLALVDTALAFKTASPLHLRLLDEAKVRGAAAEQVEALRERVEEALKGRG